MPDHPVHVSWQFNIKLLYVGNARRTEYIFYALQAVPFLPHIFALSTHCGPHRSVHTAEPSSYSVFIAA